MQEEVESLKHEPSTEISKRLSLTKKRSQKRIREVSADFIAAVKSERN